jgi:HD-like signal output (HDOD) protein
MTEEYFTAGLLHDIGKIPLNAVHAKEYMVTVSIADRNRKPLWDAEASSLGMDHCAAGAMISAAWKLEGAVGDVIVHHHKLKEYTGNFKDVLFSVAAANRFASHSEIGFSGDRYPDPLSSEMWEALNVSKEVFHEIEENVNSEIEKAEVFLKIGSL